MRAALLALALVACREPQPPIRSCADPLDGVWRAAGGERYHLLDDGKTVSLYPMWDTTRLPDGQKAKIGSDLPVVSPERLQVTHGGARLEGTGSLRLTSGGVTCAITFPLALHDCAQDEMTLVTHAPFTRTLTCHPDVIPSDVRLRRE